MIVCPKCKATLSPSAQNCQFCGADVRTVPRPVVQQRRSTGYQAPKWVWVVYTIIAAYWIFDGALDIASGSGVFGNKYTSPVVVIVGAIGAGLGLGLLFRVELVRGIANILSWIKILGGIFGILNGLMFGAFFSGLLGLILILFSVLDIVTGGLMVYLIAETEGRVNI